MSFASRNGATSGPPARLHELDRYKGLIHDLRGTIKDERDRDARFQVERYIVGLARRAQGKEPLDCYPDPLQNRPQEPAIRAIIDGEMAKVAKVATAPRPERSKTETTDHYTQRLREWETTTKNAREFLSRTSYTAAEIRDAFVKRERTQANSTVPIKNGKPTAFAQRLRALQLLGGSSGGKSSPPAAQTSPPTN